MALYGPQAMQTQIIPAIDRVQQWIDAHPGGTVASCAADLNLPTESVYYAVSVIPGYWELPTTGAEFYASIRMTQNGGNSYGPSNV